MNTKLTIALLSALSGGLSLSAFAIAGGDSQEYMDWSYATGTIAMSQPEASAKMPRGGIVPAGSLQAPPTSYAVPIAPGATDLPRCPQCAAGFPASLEPQAVIGRTLTESYLDEREFRDPVTVKYPVTKHYPISVQYPVSVERDLTIEQPVVMRQPVVVNKPVVVRQPVTVQRMPEVVQQPPVMMQQQPMYVQAPAAVSPAYYPQQMPAAYPAQPAPQTWGGYPQQMLIFQIAAPQPQPYYAPAGYGLAPVPLQ